MQAATSLSLCITESECSVNTIIYTTLLSFYVQIDVKRKCVYVYVHFEVVSLSCIFIVDSITQREEKDIGVKGAWLAENE